MQALNNPDTLVSTKDFSATNSASLRAECIEALEPIHGQQQIMKILGCLTNFCNFNHDHTHG